MALEARALYPPRRIVKESGIFGRSRSGEPTAFHLLSFEGPDTYSRAGGIASRACGLARALAASGRETHLWFVGDPQAPGHEEEQQEGHGTLQLHRWCQWLSARCPLGVYQGEHEKVADFASSLPRFFLERFGPRLASGERMVILAEEWHTAAAVLELDALLTREGLRERALLLWNANNDFGFEQLDWARLKAAATITTVSRYMRHRMWQLELDPIAIPNGVEPEALTRPNPEAVAELSERFHDRLLLAKVARWDPAKRWLFAIDSVAELKRLGERPLLFARGGIEEHENEVRERCWARGLRIAERPEAMPGAAGILAITEGLEQADVVISRAALDREARSLLFRCADAVLANSGHEPFGLVALETMAAGGVACTGNSGEEYAQDGLNALVLQTNDATEFVSLFTWLREQPEREHALRLAGRATAREYTWPRIVERALLPRIEVLSGAARRLDGVGARTSATLDVTGTVSAARLEQSFKAEGF